MIKNKGFTLLELMIVIAILGVVASVAMPAYTGYLKTARMTEAKNNVAALRLAEEEYFLENNNYFTGANATAINTNSGGLWTVSGTDGTVNFSYVVSSTNTATTYNILATGTGSAVLNETVSYTK